MKAELREITENQRRCDKAVVRSSVMPSAKYACAGSPVMSAKGSTTSTGRPAAGRASAAPGGGGPAARAGGAGGAAGSRRDAAAANR